MARSNDTLALVLLVDATADSARTAGQAARDLRTEQARRERERAAELRRHEIRGAFSTAGGRVVALAPVWLFLCANILVNNFMENYFAESSYAITTWTFIVAVAGCLVIDIAVGPGRDSWFVAGAVAGFVLSVCYSAAAFENNGPPIDVSMFWLVGLLAALGYLASALRQQNKR